MQENPSELIDINNIKINKTNDETNIQKNTTLYMNKNKNNILKQPNYSKIFSKFLKYIINSNN